MLELTDDPATGSRAVRPPNPLPPPSRSPCWGSSWSRSTRRSLTSPCLTSAAALAVDCLACSGWSHADVLSPAAVRRYVVEPDRRQARLRHGHGGLCRRLGRLRFAPSLGVLVAARVAQGVGAALITPTSLALLREAYQQSRDRARAVAYWALGGSVAAAAGPILGGLRAAANSPQRHATAATSSALSPHPPNCPVACRPTEIAQIIRSACIVGTPEPASAAVQNGGYTRVRRTEGLLRSIIGAVVHGTRRRENPSLGCGHGFLGLVPGSGAVLQGPSG